MALWTSDDAARATGGHVTTQWVANGVSIDTRTLQSGDLFIALKAARDGHEFVAQALANGAAAALVDHHPDGVAPDAPLLIVADVQAALEELGRFARARTNARVVADRIGWENLNQGNAARYVDPAGENTCLCGKLQQSLGRSVDPCADACGYRVCGY